MELNASLRLFWSRDGAPRVIVPAGSFFTYEGVTSPPGLEAQYTSRQEYLLYTRKGDDLFVIFLEWPDRELALPIPEPKRGSEASLLGREGTLPWRYEGEALRVDLSGIPFREIPGAWAWTIRLAEYGAQANGGKP